jgi:formate dehydrogenase subunit gamma
MIGPDAFSDVSQAAKYVHNFVSFSFVAGLVLIVVIFFGTIFWKEWTSTGSSRVEAS